MEHSIGPFELITDFGAGPRGSAFRARHATLGRIVAIKRLSATLDIDGPEFSRLCAEVERLRMVASSNVTGTLSVDLVDGRPLIEMESLGESLEKALRQRAFSLEEALGVLRDVLSGLRTLHGAGILHGNLKPSNVLQDTTTGSWKISDGGTTHIESQTAPTLVAMTVRYLAPETLSRDPLGSERSDLFSAGMIGLEAVLGAELLDAFPGLPKSAGPGRWLAWLDEPQEIRPLHELRPQFPAPLSPFFAKLLAKNPDLRFASAGNALDELESILASASPEPPPVQTDLEPDEATVIRPAHVAVRPGSAMLLITGPSGFSQQVDVSDPRSYRIGRGAQNDIVLPDDSKSISRTHAELKREQGGLVIADLDSQGGIWVGGRRRPVVPLAPGVVVKIGKYTLSLTAGAAQSPAAPTPKPTPKAASPRPATSNAAGVATTVATSVASYGKKALALWPPKNYQQWAAIGTAATVVIAGVLWLALRNPSAPVETPPPADDGDTVTTTTTPTPTPPPAPSRDEKLAAIRQLLEQQKFEEARDGANALLGEDPNDKDAQELKKQADDALAPKPVATNSPGGNGKDSGRSRTGRGAPQPNAPVVAPGPRTAVPQRPGESEADWIARDSRLRLIYEAGTDALQSGDLARAASELRRLQREEPTYPSLAAHLAAIRARSVQEGQTAENNGDLVKALRAYQRAQDISPESELQAALAKVRAQMLTDGTKAFNEAENALYAYQLARSEEARKKYLSEAIRGYEKAAAYLPDSDTNRKRAQDKLIELKREIG